MSDFDGGFGPSNFRHLKKIYQLELISEEKVLDYHKSLEKRNPEAYQDFLEYKKDMEHDIVNIKEALLYGEDPIPNI